MTRFAEKNFLGRDKEDIARRRKTAQDDKDFTTGKISELARYVGFGLAAFPFVLLTSQSKFAQHVIDNFQTQFLFTSVIGCLVILAEYGQYYFGYLASSAAYRNRTGSYRYDEASLSFKLRQALFFLKHIGAAAGAIYFIAILAQAILHRSS
jgi:hypothetical protein